MDNEEFGRPVSEYFDITGSAPQNLEGLPYARDKFKEMLEMPEGHKLPLAQTWGPCRGSTTMASGDYPDGNENSCNLTCYDERMMALVTDDAYDFHKLCTHQPLRRGQGIVSKALRSHRPCFCCDISKYSMTEYPLAHWAQEYKLTGSFAISMRSSYTGDLDYVLEFFMSTCRLENYGDHLTLLGSTVATMKQHLRSFKVSSGKELRDELAADIMEVCTLADKLHSSTKCRTIRSPETLQTEAELVQIPEWPNCKRKKATLLQLSTVEPTRSNLRNCNESVQGIEEGIPESNRRDPSPNNKRTGLVTIKANYADDIIRFQISSSSTMAELLENLIERLPLTDGSLHIKYQDDEALQAIPASDIICIVQQEDEPPSVEAQPQEQPTQEETSFVVVDIDP
ncbi:hypothetical protein RJ639_008147 [Escallonia herrerae]|uniref:PB1 domain-containing protein n=1 Tax=Escallonia herrerae TaxID=1293975 RepID=A0AA88VU31_9ASTE|nr:hypothetical protein RJ639_008147 [Escallonia herrerae]